MVHELLALKANAYAHLDMLAMQMITAKDASYADNAKSIKTVRALKFVSNSVVVFVTVWMHVANSPVDQTHCVSRITIVQLVSVGISSPVIRMISILAVNQANSSSEYQTYARATPNVARDKFVSLVSMEFEIASTRKYQIEMMRRQ